MSEEALEEVLRKASSDAQFRSRLQTDLEGAVRGFDLSAQEKQQLRSGDRKSTRLNSSHSQISYAVFCLKKNKAQHQHQSEAPQPQDDPMRARLPGDGDGPGHPARAAPRAPGRAALHGDRGALRPAHPPR